MPSGRDLRKWARPFFTPEMNQRGFSLVPGTRFTYYREVNGLFHYISAQQSQWSPAIYVHVYVADKANAAEYRVGSRLDTHGDVDIGSSTWPVANETEAQASFISLLQCIDQGALPYFEKIRNVSEFRIVEEYILKGGFAGVPSVIDNALRAKSTS